MTRIDTYRVFGLCVALASGGAMMLGCSDSGTNPATGSGGGSTGTTATTGASTTGSSTGTTSTGSTSTGSSTGTGGGSQCKTPPDPSIPVASAIISDFEGEAGLAVTAVDPHGLWAMDTDMTSMTGSYVVENCGTTGNGLHFKGTGFTKWGADVAAAFITNTKPVDASMYSGISFVLKSAMPVSVIVKLQNADSQPAPACGNCDDTVVGDECYAGYVKIVSTTTDNTAQTLKWTDIAKAGWGYHFPGQFNIDPTQLMSLAFAVAQGTDFDICIDDVKFVK